MYFILFERGQGPPKRRGARGNLPPYPSLSTGLSRPVLYSYLLVY